MKWNIFSVFSLVSCRIYNIEKIQVFFYTYTYGIYFHLVVWKNWISSIYYFWGNFHNHVTRLWGFFSGSSSSCTCTLYIAYFIGMYLISAHVFFAYLAGNAEFNRACKVSCARGHRAKNSRRCRRLWNKNVHRYKNFWNSWKKKTLNW